MQKLLSRALILASAMAVATLAVAAPGGQAGGPHGGWHGHEQGQMMALGKLNLSDAQRASIKQIVQASFSANKGQWKALHQQREAFKSMTPDQAGYQAAATSLAQAEGSAMQARVLQRANVRAQIYTVLNPAQKAQLATMQTQREARRQQWQQFRQEHPLPSTAQ